MIYDSSKNEMFRKERVTTILIWMKMILKPQMLYFSETSWTKTINIQIWKKKVKILVRSFLTPDFIADGRLYLFSLVMNYLVRGHWINLSFLLLAILTTGCLIKCFFHQLAFLSALNGWLWIAIPFHPCLLERTNCNMSQLKRLAVWLNKKISSLLMKTTFWTWDNLCF